MNLKLDLRDRRNQLGVGLVILGLLALLGNVGIFAGLARLIGSLFFAAAGVLVLRAWRDRPNDVWMVPVGTGLVGLALAMLDQPWSGGAFLASIGIGFAALFASDVRRWWAVIPSGVLLTLGLVAVYDDWLFPGTDLGGTLFFLGLAATFAFLYLHPRVQQAWAIWPALALGVLAVLTVSFRGGWVLPVALIAVGAYLLTRQSRPAEVGPIGGRDGGASDGDRTVDATSTPKGIDAAPTANEGTHAGPDAEGDGRTRRDGTT